MKNVKIEDAAFDNMKSMCEKYGIKIYRFASDAIIDMCIDMEKMNDKSKNSGRENVSSMRKNN